MTRKKLGFLLGTFAALAVLSGAAVVAWAGSSDEQGVINACYVSSSGTLRIVDPAVTDCRHNELPISWSVQGPPGPAGEPGQPGEPGAQGEPGPGAAGFMTSF